MLRLRIFLSIFFTGYMIAFQTGLMCGFPTYFRYPFLSYFYSWLLTFFFFFVASFVWFLFCFFVIYLIYSKSLIKFKKYFFESRYRFLHIGTSLFLFVLLFWFVIWSCFCLVCYYIWIWLGGYDNISNYSFQSLVVAHHYWDHTFFASCKFSIYWNFLDILTYSDFILFLSIFSDLLVSFNLFFLIICSALVDLFLVIEDSHIFFLQVVQIPYLNFNCIRSWDLLTPYFKSQTASNIQLIKFVLSRAFANFQWVFRHFF